ncbi:NUDIX hydrolase [Halorussus halophilus]|uniref:NUDIX hydrolase n=1 Tax=Halorussus halophilus TaxID=2650975 RepID=UPI0013015195|nr:NUDIX hydrolase [Halorussus halophilus]
MADRLDTDHHLDAVHSLRDAPDVSFRTATIEIEAENWPENPEDGWIGAGAIVCSPDRERVALVRNWWSDDQWVLPGGGVEASDDSLRAAVRREVREETGLPVEIEEALLVESQTFVHGEDSSRSFGGWFVVFQTVADRTRFAEDPGEHDEEIIDVEWFDEVPDDIERHGNRVRDVLGSS